MKKPTTAQKVLLVILTILSVIVIPLDVAIFRAFVVNPADIHVTYKTTRNTKLPASLDPISVVYISDLEYGNFETEERAQALFSKINELNPSLFLFGGDLFSKDVEVDENMKASVTELLKSVHAPLGKFAVLGEQDCTNDSRKSMVTSVLKSADIEVLEDASRLITNRSSASFQLYGMALEPNYETAVQSISDSQFSLLFTHYPDNLVSDELKEAAPSLALAGNAHGTQITWPIFGGYKDWPGSTEFNRAKGVNTGFETYLTSGTGCINLKARLNSPVEIVYLLITR